MRLAIIRQQHNPSGGAERFVSRAIAALAGQLDVTLLTRRWDSAAQPGYRTLKVDPFYLGRVWRAWSFARAVQQTLRRERFDLVQSHERIVGCDIYRAGDGVHREWLRQRRRQLGWFARVGLWFNPQNHYACTAEQKMFASPALRAVICNSRMVADELREWFGLPEALLHVIYSGIDAEVFHPHTAVSERAAIRQRLAYRPPWQCWCT